MKTRTLVVGLVAALLVPVVALANSVIVKNKDGRTTVLLVKRARSSMDVDVPGKGTMQLPGAPMTLTVKKTGSKIEALSGDTVVIEKGKLSKLGADPEEAEGTADAAPSEPADSADAEPSEDAEAGEADESQESADAEAEADASEE